MDAPQGATPTGDPENAPDQTHEVVRAHLGDVERCQDEGLRRDPGLQGRLETSVIINDEGRVLGATTIDTTITDMAVLHCLHEAIRSWTFPVPPSGSARRITLPIVLGPRDDASIRATAPPAPPARPATNTEADRIRDRDPVVVAHCTDPAQRRGWRPRGTVELALTVGPDGRTSDVQLSKGTTGNPELETCLVELYGRALIPAKIEVPVRASRALDLSALPPPPARLTFDQRRHAGLAAHELLDERGCTTSDRAKIRVQLHVDGRGRVREVTTKASPSVPEKARRCVTTAMRSMRFPVGPDPLVRVGLELELSGTGAVPLEDRWDYPIPKVRTHTVLVGGLYDWIEDQSADAVDACIDQALAKGIKPKGKIDLWVSLPEKERDLAEVGVLANPTGRDGLAHCLAGAVSHLPVGKWRGTYSHAIELDRTSKRSPTKSPTPARPPKTKTEEDDTVPCGPFGSLCRKKKSKSKSKGTPKSKPSTPRPPTKPKKKLDLGD